MAPPGEHLYAIRSELDEPLDTDADITEIETVLFSTLVATKRDAIEENAWYIRREFDRNPMETAVHVIRRGKLQRTTPKRVVPVTRRRPQQHRPP